MRRLIIRPAPKQNESLMGYLLRLAEENVFTSPLNLVWIAEFSKRSNKSQIEDHIKSITSGRFSFKDLAVLTGEHENNLEIRSYRLLQKGIDGYPDFHLFMNAQLPANFIRFSYPRFCPECMRSDPYHRFYWDYAPLTCCPIHKKLLMDICPSCHKQITWARGTMSRCSCGNELFEDDGIDVPDEQMEHVYLIANAFRNCDSRKHDLSSFVLFDSYNHIVSYAIRALPALKIYQHLPLIFQPKRRLAPPLEKSLLIPVPIIKSLDFEDIILPRPNSPHLSNIQTIRALNEYLVDILFHQKSTTRVKIRDELQWQPNAEVHQKMVKFFTGKDVPLLVDYTNLNQITARQHARHLGVKNRTAKLYTHFQLASPEMLSPSFELRKEVISLNLAAEMLGISEHLLRKLINEEIITPLTGPQVVGGYGDNLFTKKQIHDFVERFAKLAVDDIQDEATISVDDYIKSFDISRRKSFTEMIQAVFDEKIRVLGAPSGRLKDVLLSLPSVEDFCPQPSKVSGFSSVKEVSRKLNIYQDAIYRTLETGLLPFKADGRKKFILNDDFEAFNRQFVFIKEIASKYDVNPTNLADKLIDEGIQPISGPKIDKNLVYIFNRDDIDNVDIEVIISKPNYKARSGRIAKSEYKNSYLQLIDDLALLTTSEVAARLDISSQKLGKLLKIGELDLHVDGRLPDYKKYIKTSNLISYTQRYQDNPNLIKFEDAAEFLDESVSSFHNTWIKFKRIEVIHDGLGNKYVDRLNLHKLKLFKKEAISIHEASELKGIDRSYFSNLIKLGNISPVSGPGIDEYGNYFLNRQEVEEHTNENWW